MVRASNIRQMPPVEVMDEAPDHIGLRISMAQMAVYADLIPRLNKIGLTSPSRLTALGHIRAQPGCSQSDLALFTGLSRASIMTLINQLERAGMVTRRATADARTNALHLTQAGIDAHSAGVAQTVLNERKIFDGLSPEEQATLKMLLGKVIAHAAKIDRDTGISQR